MNSLKKTEIPFPIKKLYLTLTFEVHSIKIIDKPIKGKNYNSTIVFIQIFSFCLLAFLFT